MRNTLLFDLDGTLTDPGEGITNSVAYALNKWNIQVKDKSELYPFIGPPLIDSFMGVYGFSKEKAKKSVGYYREYFSKKGMFENAVIDGVEDMLKTLKQANKTLLICTSKPQEFTEKILKHFGLDKYFNFVVGASMDEKISKKEDVIAYAIRKHNLDVLDSVMIGDRNFDVDGGHVNKMISVGVTYGYGDYQELKNANAEYIVDSVEQLKQILLKI